MPEVWRLIPFDRGPSESHFALSDALVRNVQVPTLWAHAADRTTLIVGPGQRPRDIDLASVEASGIVAVRRQAGGTAVLATPDVLGVDVAVPAGHPLAGNDVTTAYRWLGEVWLDALRSLGAHVELVTVAEARAQPPAAGPAEPAVRLACFGTLSPYEVTTGGRKLVGLAQVRRRTGTLWQSGIHLHFDAEGLAHILAGGDPAVTRALRRRAAGLDQVLPGTAREGVIDAFLAALRHRLTVTTQPGAWTDAELRHAASVRTVRT
ncbi:MAG TPA: hypothetical protein VKX16_16145 [Chloroflexota bacterium]|nr:hypothetical protein [Chloroflexota bacterium]